jgi:hypothetical protein
MWHALFQHLDFYVVYRFLWSRVDQRRKEKHCTLPNRYKGNSSSQKQNVQNNIQNVNKQVKVKLLVF